MNKALAFVSIVFLFFAASCKKVQQRTLLDQIQAKGEIVIATEGMWEPWSFRNDKNELIGFDIEVAKEICARMNVRPRFVELEWERILPFLESGGCDIAANGVEITENRSERLYFTRPYAYSRTAVIVRKDDVYIKSFKDLKGKTSVNARGSTYEEIAGRFGAIPIVIDSFDETMDLLLQNRAESTLNSDLSFYDYMRANPAAQIKIAALSEEAAPVAFPCRKDDACLSLLAALDEAIGRMRADGTLKEISMKYFGRDITE